MDNPFEEIARRQDRIEYLLSQVLATLKEVGLTVTPKNEPPITVMRAAELLGVSKSTIYQNHDIPKRRRNGKLYFFESEILDYIKNGPKHTETHPGFEIRRTWSRRKTDR